MGARMLTGERTFACKHADVFMRMNAFAHAHMLMHTHAFEDCIGEALRVEAVRVV